MLYFFNYFLRAEGVNRTFASPVMRLCFHVHVRRSRL
jgi:hypothetical protein